MRNVCGNETLSKFQAFEGSQYFSLDLRGKRQLTHKISKESRVAY